MKYKNLYLCIGDKFTLDKVEYIYMGIYSYERIDYCLFKNSKTGEPHIKKQTEFDFASIEI